MGVEKVGGVIGAVIESCRERFGWGPFYTFTAEVLEASYRDWSGVKKTEVALGMAGCVQVELIHVHAGCDAVGTYQANCRPGFQHIGVACRSRDDAMEEPRNKEERTVKFLPPFVLIAWVIFGSVPAFAADLRVSLSGFEEKTGSVRVALFASAEDFAAGRQLAGYFTLVAGDTVEAVFAGLAPGRYGITTFYDQNANEKLDSNLVGMPTEPFGFSRNARGRFGPPAFDDFAVELSDEGVSLEILLQ